MLLKYASGESKTLVATYTVQDKADMLCELRFAGTRKRVLEEQLLRFPDDCECAQVSRSGVPQQMLTLRHGAVVKIMRNLNIPGGIGNGSHAVVLEVGFRSVRKRIIGNGRLVTIPRASTDILVNGAKVVRKQFPLRLGYAITVHGSQGKTLDKACFDGRNGVFAQGQLYVALSSTTTASGQLELTKTPRKNDTSLKFSNAV